MVQIYGADLKGIEGYLVKFTADVDPSGMGMRLLGRAERVVREGAERAAKAIGTLKGDWGNVLDNQRYTIQFSPAETPKISSGLDLPIAVMLLQASILQDQDRLSEKIERLKERMEGLRPGGNREAMKAKLLDEIKNEVQKGKTCQENRERFQKDRGKYLLIGTLDIASGLLSPPEHGMFGMIAAAQKGFTVVIPEQAEVHGGLIGEKSRDITVVAARDLQEVWDTLLGDVKPRHVRYDETRVREKRLQRYIPDLNEVRGVERAKRAMTVALAGGHNILLVGPSGEGKTMLAQAAVGLLPTPTPSEVYEINKVYSAGGELDADEIVLQRPFQEVGEKVTEAGLFGGGQGVRLRPGVISLAHRGLLLLDEVNLFKGALMEQLRRTIDRRVHKIQHSLCTVEYPCDFILVATMNPCKDGLYEHFSCPVCKRVFIGRASHCPRHPEVRLEKLCRCSEREISAYRDKLSKPLLQRIDLKVLVSPHDVQPAEGHRLASSTVRDRIAAARETQERRYKGESFGKTNAQVPNLDCFLRCTPALPEEVRRMLPGVYRQLRLSRRMQVKVLLVSRTIADLNNRNEIRLADAEEAIELMGLMHPYFQAFGL